MNNLKTYYGYKLNGPCVGQVLKDNMDGTYKVWVPGVYDQSFSDKPELLPDAEQIHPISGADTFENTIYAPLEIGTKVWVFFNKSDQNYPVIFGKYISDAVVKGFASEVHAGIDRPIIINHGRSRISIDKDGDININILTEDKTNNVASISISNDGSINVNSSKDISFSTSGEFRVMANSIKMTSAYDTSMYSIIGDNEIASLGGNVVARTIGGIVQSFAKGVQKTLNDGIE